MIRLLITAVTVLLLAAGGLWFLLENPDRFKDEITQAIEASTGYQVEVKGDLSWRYWPPIAINASGLTVSADSETPIATFNNLSVDVDLMPLLTRQRILDINEVTATGGVITLRTDSAGSNWQRSTPDTSTKTTADSSILISTLQRFRLEDVSVTYIDELSASDYLLELEHLETTSLASDTPFDFSIKGMFIDRIAAVESTFSSTGKLVYRAGNQQLRFDELVTHLDLKIDGQAYPPLTMNTTGEYRPSQQAMVLNQNNLQISSANINMTGVINLAGRLPRFDGVLELETADPARFGTDLDLTLPVSFLRLTTDIIADSSLVHMRTLEGAFDESTFTGTATIELEPAAAITADIRIDKLTDADYQETETTTISANATGATTELIPVDLLRETGMKLIIRIDQLIFDGDEIRNAKIELDNNRELLDLIANASGYNGKFVLSAVTELADPVTTDLRLTMDRLDIAQLTDMQGVTGSLISSSSLQFTGGNTMTLQDSLAGETTFTVRDGTLDVRPLKSVAQTIDALRGKTSSISEWPDVMAFNNMSGEHLFTNGTQTGQVMNARIENLTITALGGLDLQEEILNYELTAMFRESENGTFKVSKQLAGVRWPLQCKGSFDDTPAELCLGKDGAIQQLVAEIVKQDAKRRVTDKVEEFIDDKVPDEYKDLLKDIFRKR